MAVIEVSTQQSTPKWRNGSSRDPQPKEVRRRQRQTLSCLPCRRLKVKCDREHPCGHCVWSERASSCRYAAFPQTAPNSRSSADRSSSDDRMTPVKRPRTLNRSPKPQPPLLPKALALRNESHTRSDSATLSNSAFSMSSDVSSTKEDSLGDNSSYYNPHVVWKSKYRGASHWTTVARQLELNFSKFEACKVGDVGLRGMFDRVTNTFTSAIMYPNYPLGLGDTSTSREEILSYVPDRATTISLIENYLETIERTHPLLHVPTFHDELSRFWEHPGAVGDGWLGQLLVMLALGHHSSYAEGPSSTSKATENERLQKYLRGAETCFKRVPFLIVPTLTTLRTLSMMVLAKRVFASTCLEVDACGPLMSTVVRLAMSIGLHCDPQEEDELSPFDQEIRRRLWTTIAYMEVQMSMSTGVPLLLRSSDFNTRPPANINDADLSPSIPQNLAVRPSMEYTDSTFQIILARSFDVAIDVISRANSPAGGFEYSQVLCYGSEIKRLLHEASQVYDWSPSAVKEEWKHLQKFMLEIFLRRVLLVLHFYYGQKVDAHIHYPESYWSTLECSLALLVLQRQMSEDLSSPASRVWLAEFFKHEFYLATLVICLQMARNDEHGVDASGGMVHTGIELPQRQTIIQTLVCCRDIWARRICHSHCHFLTHMTVGTLIARFCSPNKDNFSPLEEKEISFQRSLQALKECPCGSCNTHPGTVKEFFSSQLV